jgi:hypothetical protein
MLLPRKGNQTTTLHAWFQKLAVRHTKNCATMVCCLGSPLQSHVSVGNSMFAVPPDAAFVVCPTAPAISVDDLQWSDAVVVVAVNKHFYTMM